MTQELLGWTRPRPVRVAFLVTEGEYASLVLDGVFADCYARWGGRFSLVVPCENNKIHPAYWPWLEAYGPDIVYSYVQLSDGDVLEVHERLAPSEYKFHRLPREPRLDVFGFKPSYDFAPLSSLASIFRLARYSAAGRNGAPVKIIDRWHGPPSQLLTDNFGTYFNSIGTSIFPNDAQVAACAMTVVTAEYQERRSAVPPDLITIPTETAAYEEFAHRRATSLSVLSAQFAPRLGFHDRRWHDSLNVVLGDTFNDRILFWNSRLLTPVWLDNDIGVIRVTLEALRDRDFLTALGGILKQRNHFGQSGHRNVTIRSNSAVPESIEEARRLISSTRPWGHVSVELLNDVHAIVPSSEALRHSTERNHSGLLSDPEWTQFSWVPPIAKPPVKIPSHLADVPPQQSFAEGYWCADFAIQYEGLETRFANRNVWSLPKRWRISRAFSHSLLGNGGPTGWTTAGWRGRSGNLSLLVCLSQPVTKIEVPSAFDAVRWAFAIDGQRPPVLNQLYPPSKVFDLEPSNEARYLRGILGMTGGLAGAQRLLLHPFLVDVLSSFGGTTNIPINKVMPTANRLQKSAKFERCFDLRSERERIALATLIVRASGSLRKPLDYVSYKDLVTRWKAHREAYWRDSRQAAVPDDPDEWDDFEQRSLDVRLIELRKRQILFQGHQWTCQHCHHKNWLDMSELAPQIACEVCKEIEDAPIEIKWQFRPNEFVIQSLRDHSVISLLWTLTTLQARARQSFILVDPTKLYFAEKDPPSPDAEADLLVILDGDALLCEVKASWSIVRASHIADLVELAKRLRPDIALLAVMEDGEELKDELNAARVELAQVGIKFELLTLRQSRLEDSPYL